MKKVLSTDEYLQALAMLSLGKELRKQSDDYAWALERLLETTDDKDPDIWDMFFEENETASRGLGAFLKDNNIKIDGPTSKYV